MIQEVKPEKLVLAHMGGWGQWNEVSSILEKDYMKMYILIPHHASRNSIIMPAFQ